MKITRRVLWVLVFIALAITMGWYAERTLYSGEVRIKVATPASGDISVLNRQGEKVYVEPPGRPSPEDKASEELGPPAGTPGHRQ